MAKSTLLGKFKILIGILVLSMLGVFMTNWLSHNQSADPNQNEKLQNYLNREYDLVYKAIKNTHPSEIDFSMLDQSAMDVLIQKKDSTVYWNNYLTDTEDNLLNSPNYAILFRDIQNGHNVEIGVDLGPDGKLNEKLGEKLNLQLSKDQGTTLSAQLKDFRSKSIVISAVSMTTHTQWKQLSFVFYVLVVLLIFILIYRFIFIKRSLTIWMGALISFILYSSHKFFISEFFEGTVLSNIQNDFSLLVPNLQEYIIGLMVLAFGMNLVKRSRALHKLPGEAAQVLAPLITTSGFVFITYLTQGFLYSKPLSTLHNETLQYCWEGLAFVLVSILAMAVMFYGSVVLFKYIKRGKDKNIKYALWIIGIALNFPLNNILNIQIPIWTIFTFVFSYLLILELYLENKEKNIIYTFWWIIIFSGFLASIMFFYRLNNNINVQERQIQSLYSFPVDDDTALIYTIDSILQDSELFEQLSVLPYPSGLDINDYEAYIISIFQEKGIDIFNSQLALEATDQQGITLFNNHFSTSYTFTKSVATANRLSEYLLFNPFENSYYLRYQVENRNYNNSPFNLTLKFDLYPDAKNEAEITSNYTIFKDNNLITNKLIQSSDISIKTLKSIEASTITNDINFSIYKPTKDVKIVAFSKIGGLIKPISLFSFIVSITGILLFLFSLLNTKLRFLPSELNIQFYNTSSLRTRIQLTIIMLIVFSFMIIGVVTAFYFKNVLENNNNITQQEEVRSILNDIRNSIEGVDNDILAVSTVQSRVDEMAHVHNKNLAFFDVHGKLMKSSFTEPRISKVPYDIVRSYSNPNSLTTDTRLSLNKNEYFMDFIPVYYTTQKNPYGYLGIAYKPLQNSNRSIRDFLSTILNVYIFLFLIAGALAIAIGNSITKPLAILSKKLKDFKLGKTNQALDWNRKDEIGNLINEYNTLTEKLDESVAILARTERDVAWREMAKQVAHEIKNPLTPMKLSIQYLDKAVKSNPEGAPELIQRVSTTLIEQINNLSHIANEFSNFAQMPKASNEKIIINEIVENVHDLFRKREDMEIQMTEPINDLIVFADRNQLLRIIINIVKNATQAIPTDKKGVIKISLSKENNTAVVSVKDNGSGIPDHMKDKVFTPNFTTKSSGTGLGLAISANMIDSFNGRIYFETEVGKGTEFFVEIPLMRLEDNFPQEGNRVSLD